MKIIGAGLSGLLAAHHFRSCCPIIVEKQQSLPNNHKALLRFRTNKVSDLTRIDFKRVKVTKGIAQQDEIQFTACPSHINCYSKKVTGGYSDRSIGSLDPCERFIAPGDFISKAAGVLDIRYGVDALRLVKKQVAQKETASSEIEPIISTMPVGVLADALGYDLDEELTTSCIKTITAQITEPCEVYQTLYYPFDENQYRASITGDVLIIEYMSKDFPIKVLGSDGQESALRAIVNDVLEMDFGIISEVSNVKINIQEHGKLVESKSNRVKDFIGYASREYNIYSLGRWATHRQLLMDDVVDDLKVIDRMISSNGYYR